MSEILQDAARVADRAAEVARHVGTEIDGAYVAAKGFDWGAVAAIGGGLLVALVAINVVKICIDANRTQAPTEPPHPAPGEAGYIDWANRTGIYAARPPEALPESTPRPFRW